MNQPKPTKLEELEITSEKVITWIDKLIMCLSFFKICVKSNSDNDNDNDNDTISKNNSKNKNEEFNKFVNDI